MRGTSYLLMYETGGVVAAGLMLNYAGLMLSRHLDSILFLDMTGTALVAFLLGPWWGAIVALSLIPSSTGCCSLSRERMW